MGFKIFYLFLLLSLSQVFFFPQLIGYYQLSQYSSYISYFGEKERGYLNQISISYYAHTRHTIHYKKLLQKKKKNQDEEYRGEQWEKKNWDLISSRIKMGRQRDKEMRVFFFPVFLLLEIYSLYFSLFQDIYIGFINEYFWY